MLSRRLGEKKVGVALPPKLRVHARSNCPPPPRARLWRDRGDRHRQKPHVAATDARIRVAALVPIEQLERLTKVLEAP